MLNLLSLLSKSFIRIYNMFLSLYSYNKRYITLKEIGKSFNDHNIRSLKAKWLYKVN
jgi:hypothetical protein